MAASSEIRFRIGADTSSLQRGFIEASTRAEQFGKGLEKKLGFKDALKGFFMGIGLGVPELANTLARGIAGLSEETEKSLEKIVASTEKATDALNQQFEKRRTSSQNLSHNAAEQERLQKELAEINSMKPMNSFQRFMSGAGLGLGIVQQRILEREGVRTPRFEERAQEIKAELQALALEKEQVSTAARDSARRRKDLDTQILENRMRKDGLKVSQHDEAELMELKRQENSLRDEAKEKGTSAARAEQLTLQADQLLNKQLEMQAHWREANRQAAEKIADIEEETQALGETKAERIKRLRADAADSERKARDVTRSEDERRQFAVKAAQQIAQAAKEYYDWKVKAISIHDSETTPGGLQNTTTQGVLANRAAFFRKRSNEARIMGRFSEAVRFGNLADEAENQFQVNDREGMARALGRDPRKEKSTDKLPDVPQMNGILPALSVANGHLEKIEASLTVTKVK